MYHEILGRGRRGGGGGGGGGGTALCLHKMIYIIILMHEYQASQETL